MAITDRIFLAHASEDKPHIQLLYKQLKELGFAPWFDEVDLVPGQNWRSEIPTAIKNAAVCLACLSKKSVAKKSYVQREFRQALSTYADRPPGSIYIIPVRLDDCELPDLRLPELELNLRDLHWVDLFKIGGFEKLVGAIELNVKPAKKIRPNSKPIPDLKTLPSLIRPAPLPKTLEVFKDIDEPWCPEMVMLPAGKFLMGSPETETYRSDNEIQHEVTISQPFALGCYPVTFDEYDYFCEQTGRQKPDDQHWGRSLRPVINVSYCDAEAYCVWLSEVTGRFYRLPSEAQWEYACRASTTTAYSFGDRLTEKQANFGSNLGQTTDVDAYPVNVWGLYDMHGNVWEWCADWYDDYPSKAVTDPKGSIIGTERVVRGGCWYGGGQVARVACRGALEPAAQIVILGFRCARVHEQPT